ncbi:ComF family protein [Calothrix sp. UHCC 0171]|uniref:ComF family protein n=1 Tax=Calothrix sp. UHCC 0171 TaxID=3110245 RepID=UPI002B2164E8|nr:ComF family protein [Calothrix sp. UHCC 0171]MEA5572356.1 ComF family protein [Calothrix sp. UHCC 0171]
MFTFKNTLKHFFHLFTQSNCPLCQRPTPQEFCPSCSKQLQKCQLNEPCRLWQQETPVFAWGAYGGILKRAIAVMKYNNCPDIARPLGHYLGEAWLQNLPSTEKKIAVVPIPLHPSKLKSRGFNQAALIAESFCEMTGLQLRVNGLQRVRATEAQHSLSETQRQKNLAAAFAVGEDLLRHRHDYVLLIDDIYTTGATAREATITLSTASISAIGLAVCAAGMKLS